MQSAIGLVPSAVSSKRFFNFSTLEERGKQKALESSLIHLFNHSFLTEFV
jgi:hypothetical protein